MALSPIEHLEATIGFPRGTALSQSFIISQRQNLESWLMLRGLTQRDVRGMDAEKIGLCYQKEAYFQACLKRTNGTRGRTVALGFDKVPCPTAPIATPTRGDDDDDDDAAAPPPPIDNSKALQAIADIRASLPRLIDNALATKKLELSDAAKEQIKGLVTTTTKEVLEAFLPPRSIEVKGMNGNVISVGLQHEKFPTLLRAMTARNHRGQRLNIWLTGPTGSGKTSACEFGAKALELPFGFDSSLDTDYKVNGFVDANGNVVSTEFIRIYRDGGIYVADEIDNWLPSALIALNAPLANGSMSTPGGIIPRHPDTIIIACANTWGLGATNDYVGRAKLDAASLDRFRPKIDWPYDEKLELAIAREKGGEEWCMMVQRARRAAATNGIKVIISPRATFDGIGLLEAGFSWSEVVDMALTAGLTDTNIRQLGDLSARGEWRAVA